jgi:hypothetical protein
MSVECLSLEDLSCNVIDNHIISVDIDTFVANYQLFEGTSLRVMPTRDEHVRVVY